MFNARRIARLAVFIAIGAVLHWVESLLPAPLPIPGAKLGMANLITLLAVTRWGLADGFYVAAGRALLGSLLGGTFGTLTFAMSTSGSVTAALAMGAMTLLPLSLIGISVIGALTHNVIQLGVFFLVTGYAGVWVYLPYLIVLALPSGIAIGVLGLYLTTRYDFAIN